MNTHFYDGKLSWIKQEFKTDLDGIKQIPREDVIRLFQQLEQTLSLCQSSTPSGRRNLQIIIDDYVRYGVHQGPNYDWSNDLGTEDFLLILIRLIGHLNKDQTSSILDLINCQLDEMSSGMCAQGRVYRLLQIVIICADLI